MSFAHEFAHLIFLPVGYWATVAVAGLVFYSTSQFWHREQMTTATGLFVLIALIVVTQIESFLLGPSARTEWGDGGHLFVGYMPYLANLKSTYQHDLVGGFDRFAVGRFGPEYLSVRGFLATQFPPWFGVVVLRLIVPVIGAVGNYLIAVRIMQLRPPGAIVLSLLFVVAFDFTATMTFLYGLSLAGMPLLAYLIFRGSGQPRDWGLLLLFAIFFASLADPFYALPGFAFFLCASTLFIRPTSFRFAVAGAAVVFVLWLANYADVILGVFQLVPFSYRLSDHSTVTLAENLSYLLRWLIEPKIAYNAGGAAFATLLSLIAVAAAITRDRRLIGGLVGLASLGFASAFLQEVPWSAVGVGFLETYRWYTEYVAIVIAFPLAGLALERIVGRHPGSSRLILSVLLGLTVSYGLVQKLRSVGELAVTGNLRFAYEVPNLDKSLLTPDHGSVLSISGRVDPNTLPYRGLKTLQGAGTFYNKRVADIWQYGVNRTGKLAANRAGPELPLTWEESAECCQPLDIGLLVDLDVLRMLNVGYVVSHRPVLSQGIEQISEPRTPTPRSLARMVMGSPEPLFIYRVNGTLPATFLAAKIVRLPEETAMNEMVRIVSEQAPNPFAVVRVPDGNASNVGTQENVSTDSEVFGGPYSVDGDCVSFETPAPGAWVVNIPYLPFWTAEDQDSGEQLHLEPTNVAQMLVHVPDDVRRVRLIYTRPTIADRLFDPSSSNSCL